MLENNSQSTLGQVIKNPGFLNLWTNQVLVQLSYNALNFALIIWVFRLTGSNTAVAALLFSAYLPAVVFGLFAGVLVDVTNRRTLIRWINILLSICFLSLILFKYQFGIILTITFLINSLAQFYSPAESSAIPIVVKKTQLLIANSIFSTTLYICFLLGFGLAGPVINHFGINLVFALGALLTFIAFIATFSFPSITNKSNIEGVKLLASLQKRDLKVIKHITLNEIRLTLKLIRGHLPVLSSILIMSGVQVVIGVLAVLIPSFFERVIEVKATDASVVLILPLGFGMITGGFLISKLGQMIPKRTIVGRSILVAGLLFFLMGIAPILSPVIKYFPHQRIIPLPFFYQPSLSTILAIGAFLLGMAMVSIIIPSQTVLQENTSEQIRGKVFSILGALMQGFSLFPVLLAGGLADLFGTMPIFIAMGGTIAILGFLALKPDFFFAPEHLPKNMRDFLGEGHWKN